MRHIYSDQQTSRLAQWSRRFSLFALATAVLSVIVVRSGFLDIVPSLTTFAAALIFAGLAILLAIVSFFGIWRDGLKGLGAAIGALFIAIMLLAYPAYLAYRAHRLPPIHDITTDPVNPPRFDASARLRPPGTTAYPGAATASLQIAAYPDIEPLQVVASPKTVYEAIVAITTQRKWQIVDARPPGPGRREGVIEAVARTPVMGFRDDIVIRVSALGTGSRIDIRSASRYGTHDFGTNAARVSSLLEEIDEAIGTAPPDARPEPEKKPQRPGRRQPVKR